jgi:hypothetical protein
MVTGVGTRVRHQHIFSLMLSGTWRPAPYKVCSLDLRWVLSRVWKAPLAGRAGDGFARRRIKMGMLFQRVAGRGFRSTIRRENREPRRYELRVSLSCAQPWRCLVPHARRTRLPLRARGFVARRWLGSLKGHALADQALVCAERHLEIR